MRSWYHRLRQLLAPRPGRPARFRPKVEDLEERRVLSHPPTGGLVAVKADATPQQNHVTPAGTVLTDLNATGGPYQIYLNNLHGPFDAIQATLEWTTPPLADGLLPETHHVSVTLRQDPLNSQNVEVVLNEDVTFDRHGFIRGTLKPKPDGFHPHLPHLSIEWHVFPPNRAPHHHHGGTGFGGIGGGFGGIGGGFGGFNGG
jgi:hypothetical protein